MHGDSLVWSMHCGMKFIPQKNAAQVTNLMTFPHDPRLLKVGLRLDGQLVTRELRAPSAGAQQAPPEQPLWEIEPLSPYPCRWSLTRVLKSTAGSIRHIAIVIRSRAAESKAYICHQNCIA